MIAADLRIKNGARTVETTTMRAGRSTISVPKIVATSAPITRKTSGNGASIPIGDTISARANVSLVECA